jgi:DNA-binding beta-propeller fold protein YncE
MARFPSRIGLPRLDKLKRLTVPLIAAVLIGSGITRAADERSYLTLGRQSDGGFIVSTEQRIEPGAIAFTARPTDLALHPSGTYAAVLNQASVLLVSPDGVLAGSHKWLGKAGGFRGAAWSPDGSKLYVSIATGYVQELHFRLDKLKLGPRIGVMPPGVKKNPRPGGMAITRNGDRMFVALTDRNAVAEVDLRAAKRVREYRTDNLPFEVRLSQDESTLIVSNWGGRTAVKGDELANSGSATIVVDPRGAAASGTVCLIRRGSGAVTQINVGLHPTAIAVQGDHAYVTNSGSDSLSDISISARKLARTLPVRWGRMMTFGSMPCAIAVRGKTAYICDGGDNAVCVMDLASGAVRGFFPAGYFPIAIALDRSGTRAYVLNTKGNGSVRRTLYGIPGSVHDFQGTVSIVDLTKNLRAATSLVAANNGWNRSRSEIAPKLAVYRGAIQHVLYIIKENRTYDEILGDMPQGNGRRRLCFLGQPVTPNHHAIAQQFTLFDNAYVSGTNSADGHQWCTQALANDYLEHFYFGFRTYSFDGSCAMSISSAGCLWDAALKRGRSIRDYGEFCDARLAVIRPKVNSWKEMWDDRVSGRHAIHVRAGTHIRSLRPHLCPGVLCWPLLQSDQERADLFIADYSRLSRQDRVPNLMFLTLPCDHTQGRNPGFPLPQCMVADNDLALGRVVEAVSKSPQWKNTCIFVIEDDAQYGVDHVDGHRTVYFAISPFTRRGCVDHELCNTVSMIRSIELMLGIEPMNRFDALTPPLAECFSNVRDLSPYTAVPNQIELDKMNPSFGSLQGSQREWTRKSMALDWSDIDRADARVLNQVIWHSVRGADAPFPRH